MIRKLFFTVSVIITTTLALHSQTLEEYIKQRDAEFESYAKKQDEALKKYAEEMDRQLAALDKEWTEYLKKKFAEFETFVKKQPDLGPKPKTIPTVSQDEIARNTPQQLQATTKTETKSIPSVVVPPLQKKIPENASIAKIQLTFFGTPVVIEYPKEFTGKVLPKSISEQAISDFFAQLSNTPYSIAVNSVLAAKTELNLNDYATYLLTKQASEKMMPDNNSAIFMQWFLLMKLGYKARIGYNASNLYLLIPTVNEIYEKSFFTIDNLKYYMINGNATSVSTYDKDFPEARQIFNLDLRSPLNLKEEIATRKLTFVENGKNYTFSINYNKNLIDFYNQYPTCDIRVYFDANVSAATKMSLATQLKPIIKDMTEPEAAEFLMHFVQKAFDYKTDQEQFNREKFFFAEELFHYPYSDCEDRSILFAYLVREFLNLEVVGLGYNGHMATAVKFNQNVQGDYFMRGGDKFTICDPTFINAPIGMAMPQYANQKAEIIELKSKYNNIDRQQEIWQLAMQNGAFRGGNFNDAVTDKDGNVYITGYFAGKATFGTKVGTSTEGSRDVFIAKYDQNNQLVWVQAWGDKGNESGYSLQLGDDNNLYMACSFNESFYLDYKFLKAKNTGDVAIAKISPEGKVLWVTQIGIENTELTKPFIFVAKVDKKGAAQPITVFNAMEEYQSFGLQFDETGNIVLTGANYLTAELKSTTTKYDAGAEFSATEMILSENQKLLSENYNPAVAGLIAALRLINNSTIALYGTEVQKTLDKYNPNFKKVSPAVYESLGVIQFIRNSEGIITIKTDSEKDVNFQTLRITNNARFKVSSFNSGNHQIDVMNGIQVGKSIIWYNLNSLKIMKTGDMVVDYDADHTKIRMHIAKDVLQ
ncbi:MAG TPA: hypothetical protein PK990_03360 [Salinivirgaceae bacterium]|nr:hypothetical protein [Salinivirgaceae bacterium]